MFFTIFNKFKKSVERLVKKIREFSSLAVEGTNLKNKENFNENLAPPAVF